MIGLYRARNGDIIKIDSISEYVSFGENIIILSGTVNDVIGSWDEMGNYKIKKVLGINDKHELDIVESLVENDQEGHYFTDEQNKRMI